MSRVGPASVHVWRGYRAAATPYADFAKFLGNVFVPACALLQPRAGLSAYLPAMIPQSNKPAGVPDQTALMFWRDQAHYSNAFQCVAVRAYTNLHGGAYDTSRSSAQFPIAFAGALVAEQPYFLVDAPADWMLGAVHHFVGTRPTAQTPADFRGAIAAWANGHPERRGSIDNALLCAGDDYVALWEHAPTTDAPFASGIAALSPPILDGAATSYVLPAGLWDAWPGIELDRYGCLNIQLERP